MSAVQWTPAQLAAIEDRGGTLLVSAAAGSGKTAVLVERAVRLIMDETTPVAADRLLIVTFTRAAAEELRARIAVRLTAEAAAHPESAYLRRQRLLLGRANICTVDAFCMQLLKRWFAELELPPDFTLADDAKAYAMRQNALSAVLEELYEDADFCAFASLYGRARSDAGAALYDFSRTLPHPDAVLDGICAAYENALPLCETAWGERLLASAGQAVQSALRLAGAACGAARRTPGLEGYLPALEEDKAFLDALYGFICAKRWDDAAAAAAGYRPAPLKPVRGELPGKETVKALREAVKETIERLKKDVLLCTQAEFDADRARILPLARALVRGARLFAERLFADKLSEKALEYSDFEHLALRLLCDAHGEKTDTARAVSRGFDAVLVDEYQDTNELQALLYRCLANDDGSNLFFVGDVKQSIYRFRLASPEIFIGKRRGYAPYAPGGPHPAVLTLGHNFRSAGNVIDQINDVFSCLMSRAVGDVDYTREEWLVRGTADAYDGGPMELVIVDESAENAARGDAGAVADAIARLVNGAFPVREKGGGTRPCGYGDCCVLLRSRANFARYEAELARRGIPAFADTGESPLTASEVSPLLSLLRVIDNPGQDVHLAAALLSVMFAFTPDDLTRLRVGAPRGSLYAALLQSEEPKAQAFLQTLAALRRMAAAASVAELCDEIFARTHYFAAVGAMENGAARRETLRAFTAWAAQMQGTAGGLAAFLRVVDSAVESGAVHGAAAPVLPKGAVSIMTIHRSKGLEFPVVILADTDRRFNLRDTSAGDGDESARRRGRAFFHRAAQGHSHGAARGGRQRGNACAVCGAYPRAGQADCHRANGKARKKALRPGGCPARNERRGSLSAGARILAFGLAVYGGSAAPGLRGAAPACRRAGAAAFAGARAAARGHRCRARGCAGRRAAALCAHRAAGRRAGRTAGARLCRRIRKHAAVHAARKAERLRPHARERTAGSDAPCVFVRGGPDGCGARHGAAYGAAVYRSGRGAKGSLRRAGTADTGRMAGRGAGRKAGTPEADGVFEQPSGRPDARGKNAFAGIRFYHGRIRKICGRYAARALCPSAGAGAGHCGRGAAERKRGGDRRL